jgi:hypothetical protein
VPEQGGGLLERGDAGAAAPGRFLLGPVAIGFLAGQAGLRIGLTTLAFLALAAAVIARLSRDERPVS